MSEKVSAVTTYKREMVERSLICGCSRIPECSSDDLDGCLCDDPDACLAGVPHTAMEAS